MKKEKNLFGRLMDFWLGGAPQESLGRGIGFWQRVRGLLSGDAEQPENGRLAAQMQAAEAAEKRNSPAEAENFWQKGLREAKAAESEGTIFRRGREDAPLAEPRRARQAAEMQASAGKTELPMGEEVVAGGKGKENGFFSAAFWKAEKSERQEGLRAISFLRQEPTALEEDRKSIPLGEEPAKKEKTEKTEAVAEAILRTEPILREEKAADAIDIDGLMRQFAQRLWEAREGASRRSYR